MTAGLTLNKITAQKGITIAEAASRVADLGWTPSYVQEAMTFPTDYKISKTPRDPMRQVLRSYFPMQEEKDNRVYGALDAALRGDMFRDVEPRWVEWMKLFLAIIPFPEISAARSMTVVAETAFTNTLFVAMPSEAARNGDYALPTVFLSVQSDESRHIGNGHSMLMAMINDPSNHQLLERDLKYAFWQNHAIVDAAIGTFIERSEE